MARPSYLRTLLCAAVVTIPSLALAQAGGPSRTFPEFVGAWVLDEAASTGRLGIAPRIPVRMTIGTTADAITVTKELRLHASDRVSRTPAPEIYRLDGSDTSRVDERTGATLDISHRFTLVADMLALTVTERRAGGGGGGHTAVTDAYAVAGDVLTLHRQLTSVTASGQLRLMQDPVNNLRHTFVYRREAARAGQ
jgi:hypothetical protein